MAEMATYVLFTVHTDDDNDDNNDNDNDDDDDDDNIDDDNDDDDNDDKDDDDDDDNDNDDDNDTLIFYSIDVAVLLQHMAKPWAASSGLAAAAAAMSMAPQQRQPWHRVAVFC
jgi:hypothetical protein